MNRVEFMTELAALLQNVPEEERLEAMQYYNDYFDDAGVENEPRVVKELGSPAKVAAIIRAGLEDGNAENGEFTETGFQDERFEQKDTPVRKSGYSYEKTEYTYDNVDYTDAGEGSKPRTSNLLKVILIIAIVLVGAPILIPLGIAVAAVVLSLVAAAFLLFISLVVLFAAIAITGIILVCIGIVSMIPEIAVGLALFGSGLIITVIGVIGTIASVKLCVVVFPGMIRGIVWVCRKPFERKAVA